MRMISRFPAAGVGWVSKRLQNRRPRSYCSADYTEVRGVFVFGFYGL